MEMDPCEGVAFCLVGVTCEAEVTYVVVVV